MYDAGYENKINNFTVIFIIILQCYSILNITKRREGQERIVLAARSDYQQDHHRIGCT